MEALRQLDMGLLMGGPLLHSTIDKLAAAFQERLTPQASAGAGSTPACEMAAAEQRAPSNIALPPGSLGACRSIHSTGRTFRFPMPCPFPRPFPATAVRVFGVLTPERLTLTERVADSPLYAEEARRRIEVRHIPSMEEFLMDYMVRMRSGDLF